MKRPRRRNSYNPKRKIKTDVSAQECEELAKSVQYGGNPEHKRNPGNFGLRPPASPRPDKALCDDAGIVSRKQAQELLREGARRGFVSRQWRGLFPQIIWAVTKGDIPLEAQLENRAQGTYHGYPLPESDPFRSKILEEWNAHVG